MLEPENILRVLLEAKEAIEKDDSAKLKDLSNQTLHSSSISQDGSNVAVAVIVYSLSKIIERAEYRKEKGWANFYAKIISSLDASISALENGDEPAFKESLKQIREAIDKLSGHLKKYIQDVFRKAKINKASKIYDHGISLEKTAKLLGVTMWELQSYAGQKHVPDMSLSETMNTKSRIKMVMEMFE